MGFKIISCNDVEDVNVTVSPNPTRNFLLIRTDEGNRIVILNSDKQPMYNTTATGNAIQINLLDFDSGIYSLVVTNPGGARVVKVLKI